MVYGLTYHCRNFFFFLVRTSQFVIGRLHKQLVSLSSAESEAKAITKGCVEGLYIKHLLEHQTGRPSKMEVWKDSSSAKAILQRFGPGRRAKHWEVQTLWVQQLVKIGLISLNKVDTLENVADALTKHVPRAVLYKLAGVMGYTFPSAEAAKVQNVHEHQSELLGTERCSDHETSCV